MDVSDSIDDLDLPLDHKNTSTGFISIATQGSDATQPTINTRPDNKVIRFIRPSQSRGLPDAKALLSHSIFQRVGEEFRGVFGNQTSNETVDLRADKPSSGKK